MSYPYGYMYPNEFIEGITWLPIIVTYTILISIASGSAMLLSSGILFNITILRRLTPVLFVTSLSATLVFLLGPLADLRRPDRAFNLFIYPHIIPSSSYPGVSLIALMAGLLWPILVVILVALGYMILIRGVDLNSLAVKITAFTLLLLGFTWSTYYAGLLFTTLYSLKVYNLVPMLPVEFFLQALALSSALVLILLLLHYRFKPNVEYLDLLSKVIVFASIGFVVLRLLESFRIHFVLSGSPEVNTFLSIFSSLNFLSLILALVVIVLAYSYTRTRYNLLALVAGILSFMWVFIDRWLFTVNVQSVSRTLLSVIPFELGYSWILESIALVFFFALIYFILSTWIVKSVILGGGGK